MTPPNPLQQLYILDKSSPRFHSQLSNLIHGKEYRECVQHLRDEDLVRLVEYLDSVSLKITLPRSLLNASIGSQLPRSLGSRVQGVHARA